MDGTFGARSRDIYPKDICSTGTFPADILPKDTFPKDKVYQGPWKLAFWRFERHKYRALNKPVLGGMYVAKLLLGTQTKLTYLVVSGISTCHSSITSLLRN